MRERETGGGFLRVYILRYDTNDDSGPVPRTIYGFLLVFVGSSFTPLFLKKKKKVLPLDPCQQNQLSF